MKALSETEERLVAEIRQLAETYGLAALVQSVDMGIQSLQSIADALDLFPSPLLGQSLGSHHRNPGSLLGELTKQHTFSFEMVIPTRAVVAHAILMARLNFFRMLLHVARHLPPDCRRAPWLIHDADDRVSKCIALRAAEEILKAITCARHDPPILRERAASILLHFWHNSARVEVGRILPVLTATWDARRRVRVNFGTMLGASELFSLLAEGCDPTFLEFLTRAESHPEEIAAFHEFLFGLSYEDLKALEHGLPGQLFSPTRLAEEGGLSETQLAGIFQAGDEAVRFYVFFMKRHLLATYRSQMNLAGPKKTAEQYVLSHLLLDRWEMVEQALDAENNLDVGRG